MEVHAITEAHGRPVLTVRVKEVLRVEFAVALEEVRTKTGELVLDEPFDASVFRDVEVLTSHAVAHAVLGGQDLAVRSPAVLRRVQGMAHLVAHKHIVQGVAHVLPTRQDEGTRLQVERGSGHIGVLHRNVFSSQETSEHGLGGRVRGSRSRKGRILHTQIIP